MKNKLLVRLKNRKEGVSPTRDSTKNSNILSLADIICSLDIPIKDPKEMVSPPNI